MPSKQKTSPPGLSIPKGNSREMNSRQNSYPSGTQDFVDLPSRIAQDNEFSQQDLFSLSPGLDGPNGFTSMGQWPFSDGMMLPSELCSTSDCTEASFDSRSIPTTEYDAADAQLMDFTSLSHAGFTGAMGHVTSPVQTSGPELSSQVPPSGRSPHGAFSSPQGYPSSTSALAFPFENEAKNQSGANSSQTNSRRPPHSNSNSSESLAGWNHGTIGPNDITNLEVTQMSNIFNPLPASPPHTEGGGEVRGTSSGSQTAYQSSFMSPEDAMFDALPDSALSNQNFSLGEPYYPLTPPLPDQDPNRTIRQSKQQRAPIVSASSTQQTEQPELDSHALPPETVNQGPQDGPESRGSPRDHHYYALPTQRDGKYHCPFASGEKACGHAPTTQKCAYHKYLDSHLKPYRCKVPQCVDSHFSSNACLFRHEREAHGMHGHGENPHLCLFSSCERSIPGNGFPRRWNLHDHMRRVHDYATSDKGSSPEGSPVVTGQSQPKKKENAVRKRKGGRASGGSQPMKRGRSNQSQTNTAVIAGTQSQQSSHNNGQQLQKAEQSYYNCLSRLRDDLNNMSPHDSAQHDKANASLQELHTLGLNYRFIRAGQMGADRYSS